MQTLITSRTVLMSLSFFFFPPGARVVSESEVSAQPETELIQIYILSYPFRRET